MEIIPLVVGLTSEIWIGTGVIYLTIGFATGMMSPENQTFSLPRMLILELEQNALLLYRC